MSLAGRWPLPASSGDSLEVICRTPCDVLFIDYPHILKRCERACTHHSLLVQNMLRLMSDKAQALSERVDVLSRRSIREKLLCYFRQLADKAGERDLYAAVFSQHAGGLHRHGPQRHDAGAQAAAGRGRYPVGRTADLPSAAAEKIRFHKTV